MSYPLEMNHVLIGGRVVRDAYIKTIASGSSVVNFTLCVTDSEPPKTPDAKKKVHFIECSTWTRHPDEYQDMLKQGAKVLVVGSLAQESWMKDGVKKSVTRVKCENVIPERQRAAVRSDAPQAASGSSTGQEASTGSEPTSGPDDDNLPF